jgi:predicted O-methyltransferase YrrM
MEHIERENADGSISFIPIDPANSDYQRYLRWLENPDAEEGGTL